MRQTTDELHDVIPSEVAAIAIFAVEVFHAERRRDSPPQPVSLVAFSARRAVSVSDTQRVDRAEEARPDLVTFDESTRSGDDVQQGETGG
ncbi:hypothetical protein DDQ50_07565 [Amnibacterium flavum]|uniref:Uncharacterized protein n=1 Tax=Amnibacterium flavum TaxID=2173173 RepID=A0A2V1HY00_9MICO|nr:hypothetical protein DDQ50_07565 [Amnibacterium flavum]